MPRIPRPSSRLGDLERAVMDVLWTAPEEEQWWTVRDVHANLAEDRDIAYTTVMTVLDRLAKKSVVLQQKEGRVYRHRAAASQGEMTAEVIRDSLSAPKPNRNSVVMGKSVSVRVHSGGLRTTTQTKHTNTVYQNQQQ